MAYQELSGHFFCISAVSRILRGAIPREIQVQASCIHLESSVWSEEGRMEMHFECELDFEMMIEFFITSPRVQHCRCRNQMARCCLQHLQRDSAYMNRLVGVA